ncbi:hypothetical protein DIPPA_34711 [Diplonema papillatum]|nr:hypothetical protein DIPPA_34711 [Diplonema papillatum]
MMRRSISLRSSFVDFARGERPAPMQGYNREAGLKMLLRVKAGEASWVAKSSVCACTAIMRNEGNEGFAWDYSCVEAVEFCCGRLLADDGKELRKVSLHWLSYLAKHLIDKRERLSSIVVTNVSRRILETAVLHGKLDGLTLQKLFYVANNLKYRAEDAVVQHLLSVFARTPVEAWSKYVYLRTFATMGVAPEIRMDLLDTIRDDDLCLKSIICACDVSLETCATPRGQAMYERVVRTLDTAFGLKEDPGITQEGVAALLRAYDLKHLVDLAHRLSSAALAPVGGFTATGAKRAMAFKRVKGVVDVLLAHVSAPPAELALSTQQIVHVVLVFSRHYSAALHGDIVALVRKRPGDQPAHQILLVIHLSRALRLARALPPREQPEEDVILQTETTIRSLLASIRPETLRQVSRTMSLHAFILSIAGLPDGVDQYPELIQSALEILSLDRDAVRAWPGTLRALAAGGWQGSDVLPELVSQLVGGHDAVQPKERAALFSVLLRFPQVEPAAFNFFATKLVQQRVNSGLDNATLSAIRSGMADRSLSHAALDALFATVDHLKNTGKTSAA